MREAAPASAKRQVAGSRGHGGRVRPATGLLREQGAQPSARATPAGQETPVPPRPQYPLEFLWSERYCWCQQYVNGQVAVPAGGQLKVSTPRVDLGLGQGGSSFGSGLAHAV